MNINIDNELLRGSDPIFTESQRQDAYDKYNKEIDYYETLLIDVDGEDLITKANVILHSVICMRDAKMYSPDCICRDKVLAQKIIDENPIDDTEYQETVNRWKEQSDDIMRITDKLF